MTGAIAVLTALTAYGALGGVREPLRAPAAVLARCRTSSAAYLAQGAFKEPMLGLALLGFALLLPAFSGSGTGGSRPWSRPCPTAGEDGCGRRRSPGFPPG